MFEYKRENESQKTEVDMIKVNKELKKKPPERLKIFHKHTVEVDYKTGRIIVDGKEVDLKLPKEFNPQKFRWVNFKRHSVKIYDNGSIKDSCIPVIGWQATFKGKNYQRMIALKEGGWELWTKR